MTASRVSVWRQLRPVLRPYAGRMGAAYACMVIYALTTAMLAFFTGPTLSFMFSGDVQRALCGRSGSLRGLWRHLPAGLSGWVTGLSPEGAGWLVPTLLVATAGCRGLAQLGQLTLMGSVSQGVLRHLREDAFRATLRQSPAFFAARTHGDVLSRLTTAAHQVEQALFDGLGPLLRDSLSVVALMGFCALSDRSLAVWLAVAVPLAALPLARFTRWLKRAAAAGQVAAGDLHAVCDESLAGVRVVQAFGGEPTEEARLAAAGLAYSRARRRAYLIRAVRSPTMEGLAVVVLAVLIGMMGHQVRRHHADPAHYVSFFAALVMMYDPIKKLGYVGEYLAHGASACERIFELTSRPPEVASAAGAPAAPRLARGLRFAGVNFAYADGRPVLKGLELDIAAGEKVALVGPSGGGKTTLASLVQRLYDVTGGQLLWEGRDIRDWDLASLRRQTSWVGQDTFLFRGSVAQNVAYGAPEATPAAIEAACRAAHADAFIARLPRGYDTPLGERGVILSGGQKQRLAIARALLRDTSLLIFDEATSHLDVVSERAVQAALAPLLAGRTALIIAHRFSTLAHADTIAVVDAGRIVEHGSHAALLAAGGAYARLHAVDAAGAR